MFSETTCSVPTTKRVCCAIVLCLAVVCHGVGSCSPGRSGARRRSARKLTPLVFKQHVPNVPESSLGASGPPEGRIHDRVDPRFRNLVPNYNADIVFKDEEGTGVDRLMTRRCKEKLDVLAISAMNMWPGVRLRVTEGFDEEGGHPAGSLHYEGRAVAVSTSDRDTAKYGMLARLAVDAGFDWVFYEARSHIYCSVKAESTATSAFGACFHGSSTATTRSGAKPLNALRTGDEVLTSDALGIPSYSPVIGFLHRDPELEALFVRLTTSSGHTLLATPEHLLFRPDGTASHARDIQVGHSLVHLVHGDAKTSTQSSAIVNHHVYGDTQSSAVVGSEEDGETNWSTQSSAVARNQVYRNAKPSTQSPAIVGNQEDGDAKPSTQSSTIVKCQVYGHANGSSEPSAQSPNSANSFTNISTKVSTVASKSYANLRGVYAPLTESGTIVVDGVACSCYAVVRSHDLAHFAFYPLRKMHNAMPKSVVKVYSGIFEDSKSKPTAVAFDAPRSTIHWYARLLSGISNLLSSFACYNALIF